MKYPQTGKLGSSQKKRSRETLHEESETLDFVGIDIKSMYSYCTHVLGTMLDSV